MVDYLKKNIESGNWTVGEKIPSENQMTEELGVSRSSIRTALQYLIGLGVLESVHGKGTYLINSRVENWDETENKNHIRGLQGILKRYWNSAKILEPDDLQTGSGKMYAQDHHRSGDISGANADVPGKSGKVCKCRPEIP